MQDIADMVRLADMAAVWNNLQSKTSHVPSHHKHCAIRIIGMTNLQEYSKFGFQSDVVPSKGWPDIVVMYDEAS